MQRGCDTCRVPYEAKRPSSKYCSDSCRKRAQRGGVTPPASSTSARPAPSAVVSAFAGPDVDDEPSLVSATRAELVAANRLSTSLGQGAMILARRLESGELDTGSGVAALVREHRAALAEAVAGAAVEADPLDQMAAARAARRAVG